ncbi:MAG: ABC transporter permease [Polyangiaceae bacterium]
MSLRGPYTLFRKEVLRFKAVALQTLVAPVITALLYVIVFAQMLSSGAPMQPGVDNLAFLVPGLAMMSLLQNAFSNSSSSLMQSKLNGNLVFVLLSPLSPWEIFAGFTAAAAVRGLVIGAGIVAGAAPFVHLSARDPALVVAFAVLGGALFGALGLIAALWATRFEELAGFQSFVVVPLSFLSGVFYRVDALPEPWRRISLMNPCFYLVDGFRHGFFGGSGVPPGRSLALAFAALLVTSTVADALLARGYKIRT